MIGIATLCSIDGCGRGGFARGLCSTHYARLLKGMKVDAPFRKRRHSPVARPCVVAGCKNYARCRDWCMTHYSRWRLYGDPLAPRRPSRKPVRVRWIKSDGYAWTYDKGRRRAEHRVIAERLLGRPLEQHEEIHHKNGVRDDNRPENLELWSRSQPNGQRVEDKIAWCLEFLAQYGDVTFLRREDKVA